MKRTSLFIVLLSCFVSGLSAGERTPNEIKKIAWNVLNETGTTRAITRDVSSLEIVEQLDAVTIVADNDNGFVIVSNQDSFKPVIGYSYTKFDAGNMPDGFKWWLKTINSSMSSGRVATRGTIPSKLKPSVEPMIETKWGQGAPFNNLCPSVSGQHCVTGCVATAMAQICKYHRYPEHGYGNNSYSFTLEGRKTTITMDFSNIYFDYSKMLNSYAGTYNSQHAEAVATLMEACGKAAEMSYGLITSGTSCGFMQSAMAIHLGYTFGVDYETTLMQRLDETTRNNIIYSNISKGLPVYYEGGSHGFIFDGYDQDGNVHVNWGWNGNYDGYYSIDNLSVDGKDYNKNQRMLTDIRPDNYELQVYEVNVPAAGTLNSMIDEDEVLFSDRLKVVGDISTDDFICLRRLIESGKLVDLDLYDAHIVAGDKGTIDVGWGNYFTIQTEENRIPDSAFRNTGFLTGLILPKNTISIGKEALLLCSLKKLFIPASLIDIPVNAIGKADLLFLEVEEGNPIFDSRNNCNGIIVTATNELFAGCLNTKIPDEVTSIGKYAFDGCIWLKNITLPSGLVNIGDRAFEGCSRLRSPKIPEGVKTIGEYAFSGCSDNLTELELPSTLETIGNCAFATVKRIQSFTLPASVKSIGRNIIARCKSLTSVKVEEGNKYYDSRDNCNGIIETANNELVASCAATVIPESVTSIGDYGCHMMLGNEFTVPEGITNIGEEAFSSSLDLQRINLPNSLTSIGSWAFSTCQSLESLVIPDKITIIPRGMAQSCYKLGTVTIPNGVINIEPSAFANCPELTTFISKVDHPFEIGENVFSSETYSKATLIVPLGKKEAYQATNGWNLFANIEEQALTYGLIPIETETALSAGNLEGRELMNSVINDVYYNIGADGYDNSDQCITISKETIFEQIANNEPGSDDVVNNYSGIILKVGKGKGTIKVDALTLGQSQIVIQVGNNTPTIMSKTERGDVTVDYEIDNDSYVYIYSKNTSSASTRGSSTDVVKIYGIVISPVASGIKLLELSEKENGAYYTLEGRKTETAPTKKGIYIKNRKKIVVN